MMKRDKRALTGILLLLLALAAGTAAAQDYPTRPIRFIVPYPPAGGTDIVARIISEPLAAALGQPIIIENRGGAAGNIGTDIVAKAAPDGYTILFTLSSHTINPKLYDKLPFDVENDFVPISLAALIPQILVANPALPVNNVRELIALAKAQPGKLNFASVGHGLARPHRRRALQAQDRRRHRARAVQGRRARGHRHAGRPGAVAVRLDSRGDAVREGRQAEGARRHERQAQPRRAGRSDDRRGRTCPITSSIPGTARSRRRKRRPPIVAKLQAAFAKVLAMPDVKEKLLRAGRGSRSSSTPEEFDRRIHARAEEVGIRDPRGEDQGRNDGAARTSSRRSRHRRDDRRPGRAGARGAARVRERDPGARRRSRRPRPAGRSSSRARNRALAELAVRDTGLGNVDDKIAKNRRKTMGLLRDLAGAKSVGVIAEDRERGLIEIARPVGVVARDHAVDQSGGDAGQQHHQRAQGPQRDHRRAVAQGRIDACAAARVRARRARSRRRAAGSGAAAAGADHARGDR